MTKQNVLVVINPEGKEIGEFGCTNVFFGPDGHHRQAQLVVVGDLLEDANQQGTFEVA